MNYILKTIWKLEYLILITDTLKKYLKYFDRVFFSNVFRIIIVMIWVVEIRYLNTFTEKHITFTQVLSKTSVQQTIYKTFKTNFCKHYKHIRCKHNVYNTLIKPSCSRHNNPRWNVLIKFVSDKRSETPIVSSSERMMIM